jgi:hypothetical protein
MAVLRPYQTYNFNYPDNQTEMLEGEINPEQPELREEKSVFKAFAY